MMDKQHCVILMTIPVAKKSKASQDYVDKVSTNISSE